VKQEIAHLTDAQINEYLQQESGSSPGWIEKHLEDCESCLQRVLHSHRIQLGLLEGDLMSEEPRIDCPPEEVVQEIAAGIASAEMTAHHTQHIAKCSVCGPLLKRYLNEFSTELEPEDAALIEQLQTATPKWQREFVRKNITAQSGTEKAGWAKQLFTWPKLVGFGALAAVVVAALTIGLSRYKSNDSDRLVASAFSERRTIEMRLTSVPYTEFRPLKTTLGAEEQGTGFDRPNLLAAKAEVGKKLKSGDRDPKLLQLEGRIALLDGSATEIITARKALEQAKEAGLDTPSLQIDLAASYFEYELRNHPDQPDLRHTIDLLKAVVDDPKLKSNDENRLVAMFDLGLAYEKSNMDLAKRTWDEYLQIDSSSDWAKEAKSHRDKLASGKQQSWSIKNDPATFLSDAAAQENAEEYMDAALISWLPEAIKEPGSNFPTAVQRIADLMARKHSDLWLQDFWQSLHVQDVRAVEELSAAVRANKEDRTADALKQAQLAEKAFAKQNNIPGELRAQFEEVYAYQRRLNGRACQSRAGPLAVRLLNTKYPWLQSQTALETAICLNFLGNYSTIDDQIAISKTIATNARFSTLLLRVLGIAAGIHRQTEKKCEKAWRDGVQGLHEYWNGIHPEEDLYPFYAVLAQCAEQTENYYTSKALLEQAIWIQEDLAKKQVSLNNAILRSTLYLYLANILEALDEIPAAEQAIKNADLLLDKERNEYSALRFRLTAKIRLANIQNKLKKPEMALATLMQERELLIASQDKLYSIDFYRILGDIYFELHALTDAASAYQQGIVIAENSLSTFKIPSERLQWTTKTEDLYRGLSRVFLQQNRSEDAWKLWEWYRSRSMVAEGTAGSNVHTTNITWAALQQRISDTAISQHQTVRIVYVTYEDGVEAWTITAGQTKSHWIPISRHVLEESVKRFTEMCSTGSSSLDELHALGRKLYSILIAPVLQDSPPQTLVIETDRTLQNLPMEALRSPDGRYVIDKFPVLYSPGVLVERTLRKPVPFHRSAVLLQLQGSGYVPDREAFRAAIGRFFPRNQTIEGERSSLPEIQAALAASDVFNFIGHGKENGMMTALRVKDQPEELLLRAGDIPRSVRRLELATLAACSTGISDENGLLDTENLANSFLAAGVPSVIASRWAVVSDSTQTLMRAFYENFSRGAPATSALQKAQKELLITQDHPYYWAGLYLAGRTN
jgi:CHAT domain-containing protein/predicted negative regulator of RcsB-dependent stress response